VGNFERIVKASKVVLMFLCNVNTCVCVVSHTEGGTKTEGVRE
jgi:hypothetical protein